MGKQYFHGKGELMIKDSATGLWLPETVVDEMTVELTEDWSPTFFSQGESSIEALLNACIGMRKVLAEMHEVDKTERVLPDWIVEGRHRVAELSCLGFRCFERSVKSLAVHNRMRVR